MINIALLQQNIDLNKFERTSTKFVLVECFLIFPPRLNTRAERMIQTVSAQTGAEHIQNLIEAGEERKR